MNIERFTGPGSTSSRRRFWDSVVELVASEEKLPGGKHVVITEYQGYGSLIDVTPQRTKGTPTPPPDCTSCDDLPPTNPLGPPVHINIVRTLSGSCGTGTGGGSMTYDHALGFTVVGPIGGHIFCAHNIFDNGFGALWTGSFTCNGSLVYNQGFGGLLGRDFTDCSWWFNLDGIPVAIACGGGGCGLLFSSIFQMIAGPGDPSGVYIFTETASGFTMTTTLTIT